MLRQPEPQGGDDHRQQFPIKTFPPRIERIAHEYITKLAFDHDYVCSTLLAAFATAIGSSYKLQVVNRYIEKSIIWLAFVGASGTKKTAVLQKIFEPFYSIDANNYRLFEKELDMFEATKGENSQRPKLKKCLQDDHTYEALCLSHHENPKGAAIIPDEICSMLKSFGRYKNGGGDEDRMLSLWNGAGLNIIRKNSKPLYVDQTNISIVGGLQTKRIQEMLTEDRKASGFSWRFIYTAPDAIATPLNFEQQFPPGIYDEYYGLISNLYNLPPDTKTLKLSQEATELFKKWQIENCEIINNDTSDEIASLRSKWTSYVLRFSLILQGIWDACEGREPETVSPESMEKAIQLFDYFYEQTIRILGISDRPLSLQGLKDWHYKLYQNLPASFMKADAIATARRIGITASERTIENLLYDPKLFNRNGKGSYAKKVKHG